MIRRLILGLLAAIGAGSIAAQAAEPIHLKFGAIGPPIGPWNKALVTWADRVNKEADGLFDIKIYPGGTLVDFGNVYDRVLNGVADIGFGNLGIVGDQFPKSQVSTLPFLAKRGVSASRAMWRLYAQGITADEYARVKPIALFSYGMGTLHLIRPIQTIAEIKGLKILITSRTAGQLIELLGAVPVTSNFGDTYGSLNRGLGQGILSDMNSADTFKFDEVAKYHLDMPLGQSFGYFFFNRKSFDALPSKAKEIIERNSDEVLSAEIGTVADEQDDRVRAKYRSTPGQVLAQFPPPEEERVRKLVEPLTDNFVKQTPNGAAVLAAYRDQLKEIDAGK